VIELADPRIIYQPEYDPAPIWVYYPKASWYYPHFAGGGNLDFGAGFPIRKYFGGGWDWQPSHNIIANNYIRGYNINPSRSGGMNERNESSHDGWNRKSRPAWIGIRTIEETAPFLH